MAGYIGSKAVNLSTTGADINGDANIDGDLSFRDNDKVIFGAGSDLQIYHDGSHSFIDEVGTGRLYIRASDGIYMSSPSNALYLSTFDTGGLSLYHNGNAKLVTTSTGIDVTGDVDASSNLRVNGTLLVDSSMNLQNLNLVQVATGSSTAPSIRFTGDTNTGFARPAADTLGFITGGTERMRIDSSGNLLVGTTSNNDGVAGIKLRESGEIVSERAGLALKLNRQSSDGEIARFQKDGTTVGSIGNLDANTIYIQGGSSFYGAVLTSPNSSGNGVRLIDNNSNARKFSPSLDNVYDLGDSSERFDDIYATNGTIQTSDRNEKQDIAELTDAEQRVAVAAKGLMRKFRWRDAVEAKGDNARTHFGIIAQDLQAAFAAEGLDAGDYAMFISSTWTDEETGEERTRMGVRYSELLAFIIGAL